MPDSTSFGLFLTAAILLAITPGPGIFYVLTRSIKGGRGEGYASSFGTAVGGLAHVVAAALGLSAILATSAWAFAAIKYAGAAYLVYLGVRTLMRRDHFGEVLDEVGGVTNRVASSGRSAFLQGTPPRRSTPRRRFSFSPFCPSLSIPMARS